jgi:hypothetical protein
MPVSAKRISAVFAAALVLCIGLFVLWLFEGSIRSKAEMRSGLRAIEQFDLSEGVEDESRYGVDTFTHQISSLAIEDYYDRAATALNDKGGDLVVTYLWMDGMGWPRVSTVLEGDSSYIEVLAAQNNDNDSISILFRKGKFSRPDTEISSSSSLPQGTLRSK